MGKFEEMKERYPRGMIIVQGLWILILATIFSFVLISPISILNISPEVLVDVFMFPVNVIPEPYNFVGLPFIPIGFFLIIWANYSLLVIGKIGLRNREPMQRPSNLVLAGPYRFSRNPLYLGILVILAGLIIFLSSIVTAFLTVLVYIIFRYVFIKKEEILLEEEFGDEYRDFMKRVKRWF
ncbi:MAG: isoprenylcysteine carboxylmethyltransferase family protein [Candidatus Thorarchaeota archaeon]